MCVCEHCMAESTGKVKLNEYSHIYMLTQIHISLAVSMYVSVTVCVCMCVCGQGCERTLSSCQSVTVKPRVSKDVRHAIPHQRTAINTSTAQ